VVVADAAGMQVDHMISWVVPAHSEGLLTNILNRVGAKARAYNSTYLDDSPAVEVKVVVEEVD
jgi:hypothetical protein